MAHIRKDDDVLVIAGKDKGVRGKVLRVLVDKDRVVVEGVNVVKRHRKATTANPTGGITTKPAPIHVSNVMLWSDETGGAGRVGQKFVGEGGTQYATRGEAAASFGDNRPQRIVKVRASKPGKRGK